MSSMTDVDSEPSYKMCGAKRRGRDEMCKRPAGWGTKHVGIGACKLHGGAAPSSNVAGQRLQLEAECERLGLPIQVSPTQAMLNEIWETAGNIQFYRLLVQQLPTHPEDDQVEFDHEGKAIWRRGAPGVYGRTYHVSGVPTGEAKPHVLVQLYNDERKHLVDVTKSAIGLGLEQRRVDLEENRAAEVFRAVTLALTSMGLAERFHEFREHFATALSSARQSSQAVSLNG